MRRAGCSQDAALARFQLIVLVGKIQKHLNTLGSKKQELHLCETT